MKKEIIFLIPFRGGLVSRGASIMMFIGKEMINIFTHISPACSQNPECFSSALLITDIFAIITGGLLGLAVSKKIIK